MPRCVGSTNTQNKNSSTTTLKTALHRLNSSLARSSENPTIDKMKNTQSNTDTKNNLYCHDSLDYPKPKPKTLTFTIDTIQGVNCCGPNLRDRGNDVNNGHPSPSRNTKNQSSNSNDSGNKPIPAQRGTASMEIILKPGILNLLNVETIPNSIIWEQSN